MIAADSSRITPTKMKHQVAITPVRSSGAVICHSDLQPRGAEDAAGVLQFGMDGAERRLQLLIGRRQRDGDEGDQQDPQRAVEHERRPRVAEEQPDAEHDAGNGDRRGGEEAEHAMAGDRLARGDIGDDQRDRGADGRGGGAEDDGVLERQRGRRQFEQHEIDVVQREVLTASANVVATGENAALNSARVRQEHRQQQHRGTARTPASASARSGTRRGAPYLPPTTE